MPKVKGFLVVEAGSHLWMEHSVAFYSCIFRFQPASWNSAAKREAGGPELVSPGP